MKFKKNLIKRKQTNRAMQIRKQTKFHPSIDSPLYLSEQTQMGRRCKGLSPILAGHY